MSKNKTLVPNIVRGGTAIPINKNTFLLRGRKHEQGGIDIGKDLEAEDGELIQLNKNNLKILSNAPIMKGDTPAKYALRGLADNTFKDRFNKGFLYQEKYKDRNHLNDDGTKKKGYANKAKIGKRKIINSKKYSFEDWKNKINLYKGLNIDEDNTYDYKSFYEENPENAYSMLNDNPDAHFIDKYKLPSHPTFSNESIYSNKNTEGGNWKYINGKWIFNHSNYTFEHSDETNQYLRENDDNSQAIYKNGIVLDSAKIISNRYKCGGIKKTNKARNGKLKKFFKDAAYKIITQDSVHDDAKANIKDIVTGLTTKNPPMDDNKYLFVYGNDKIGLPPADTTKGKNFDKYIKENYPDRKINQYEGQINPYNKYVFDESDKNLIEELAKKKKHFYSNADKEYLDYITEPNPDAWGERPEGVYMNTPYREDIGHYPLQFDKDKNGNLIAHAADLYDFNAKEYLKKGALVRAAEAAALTSVGNPYILRQNNIPIRFINLGDKIRKNPSSYFSSTKSNELNNEEKRALNMHAILNAIPDKELSNILGNGYIEPAKVIVKKK